LALPGGVDAHPCMLARDDDHSRQG